MLRAGGPPLGDSGIMAVDGAVTLPYAVDFSGYPDGPMPAPFLDLARRYPTQQDPVGIRDGAVADVLHLNDNYGGTTVTTGWRGGAHLLTDASTDFEVVCNIEAGSIAGLTTGGPMVLVDPSSNDLGLGCWYSPLFNYIELGNIGVAPSQFRFLDVNWCPDLSGAFELKMRVVGTQVAVYLDGDLFCGPVTIPAGLRGSRRHGVQTDDLATSTAETPTVSDVTMTRNSTPLDTYSAATITDANRVGTPTKFTSGTTLNVPYPATVTAGDLLVCVVGNTSNRSITAPAGWTTMFNSGFSVYKGVFTKVATGSETGTLAITHSGAVTNGAGVIFAVQNVSPYLPVDTTSMATGNFGASPVTAGALNLIGLGRIVMLVSFGNINAAHTHPAGYSTIAETTAGGATCRLKVTGQAMSLTGNDTPYTVIPAATVTATGQTMLVSHFQVYPRTHS